MVRDRSDPAEPSRREYLSAAGLLLATGGLAGCSDDGGAEPPASNSTDTQTVTPTETESPTPGETSYTVEMAPAGSVEFQDVPRTFVPWSGDYADMAVALGQSEGLVGIGGGDRYHTFQYEELDGVSVDHDQLETYGAVRTKEEFYELDADIHLYDAGMLRNWFDWDDADLTEISENVAPFLGNLIFRREDEWHDYRYYTLYEAFEKVATVFQEQERYRAFVELHDEFIARIQAQLPPADDRPNVLLTFDDTDAPEKFSPYRLNDHGTSKKQWRDLGVADALAGTGIKGLSTTNRGKLDYETLLEIDPDVIMMRGQEDRSPAEFRDDILGYMQEHPVGSQLTAVQNERVYRGGFLYQGPIQNLFLTERAAKQLYPETFGAVTDDEELFDRDRVLEIVNGEIDP